MKCMLVPRVSGECMAHCVVASESAGLLSAGTGAHVTKAVAPLGRASNAPLIRTGV